jgi:magnesium transporter
MSTTRTENRRREAPLRPASVLHNGMSMRRSIVYRDGHVLPVEDGDAIRSALEDGRSLLWVDILSPTDEDFAALRDEFEFHPLAMEDAMRGGQRAKVDEYPEHSLIVLFDLGLDAAADQAQVRELTMFVAEYFVITLHQEPIHAIDDVWSRLEREPSIIKPHPLSLLVYQLADCLVDDYFPIVDRFDERLADLEEQLFNSPGRVTLPRMFTIRKELVEMRRLVNQMRDVFNVLTRREQIVFNQNMLPYYTDVYDHLLRISDTLELQRDILSGALEAYLSIQSNELNVTVRKLTAATVMVMVPTLIAGIYGMNFDYMPELQWLLGYPMALGLMAASGAGLYLFMRRIGWL